MTEREAIDRSLALARAARWAPEQAKARVRANLGSNAGTTGAAPAVGLPALATLPSWTARLGSLTKRGTVLWIGAAFAVGYWLGTFRATTSSEAAAPSTPSTASAPTAQPAPSDAIRAAYAQGAPAALAEAEPAAPAPPVAPRQQATLSARAARRAAERAPATEPAERARGSHLPGGPRESLADELALLSRSERAIRAGEPVLALALLDELEARHPRSRMSEERSAVRVLAECALSAPAARRRAELFLRDRSASVYSDRVRHMCALDVTTPEPPGADGSALRGH
jgi:hypothetical protein